MERREKKSIARENRNTEVVRIERAGQNERAGGGRGWNRSCVLSALIWTCMRSYIRLQMSLSDGEGDTGIRVLQHAEGNKQHY